MKNKLRISITILAILGFIFLNWATSPQYEFIDLNATVSLDGSRLVLANVDSIAVADASLFIKEDNEIANYWLSEYNLAAGATDTIPLKRFLAMPDSIPFPETATPRQFVLEFYAGNRLAYVFSQEF